MKMSSFKVCVTFICLIADGELDVDLTADAGKPKVQELVKVLNSCDSRSDFAALAHCT